MAQSAARSPSSSASHSLESFPSLSSLSFDETHELDNEDLPPNQSVEDDLRDGADEDEDDTGRRPPTRRSPRQRSRKSLQQTALCSPPSPQVIEPNRPTDHTLTRQLHYQALFVHIDPPLLGSLRHLELAGLNLKRTDLRILTTNLFLLEALTSLNLADNQLDDSCLKEIRLVLSLNGLEHLDLSKNLLGRGTAKMLADRLRHRLAVRSLDLSGNPRFFAFDDARDVARDLARAVVTNQAITDFRLSLPVPQPHLEQERLILLQESTNKPRPSQRHKVSDDVTPAEAFTRQLCECSVTTSWGGLSSLGLVHAELSRRTIVNLMKLANKLVALDLSFAFVGIPAAQVIATALKMPDYATLTQLNLCGNRLKSMGARALCRALHSNSRITDLNLSRNELRNELLPEITAMLHANHTLVRLDLTRNDDLLSEVKPLSTTWQALLEAMRFHYSLLSLGPLERLGTTMAQREALQKVLDRNQQKSDELVLVGVHQSMAFDSGTNDGASLGSMLAITLSSQHASEKTLWKHRQAMVKQARVSIKWKMKAFVPPRATSKREKEMLASSSLISGRIRWRVMVCRKCDLFGTSEHEAASGVLVLTPVTSSFVLCSALVYCDAGDSIRIVVSLHDNDDCDEVNTPHVDLAKVLAKDFVVLPHPLPLRHVSLYFDASEHPNAPTNVEWQLKRIQNPMIDPYAYTTELSQAYVAHTTCYRLVWRVRLTSLRLASASEQERTDFLNTQLLWRVLRSPCWDPDTSVVVIEGSSRDLGCVVRNDLDLVICTPPHMFVAGEVVHLGAETTTDHTSIVLLQWFVLVEKEMWDNGPSDGSRSPRRERR